MTSHHVSVLCNISIAMGCPNNGERFNECGLLVCAKYTLNKLLQYQPGIHTVPKLCFVR